MTYYNLTTTAIPIGGGTIVPSNGSYLENTTIGISGLPSAGSLFVGWGGDLGGTQNPREITFDNDKDVTATFEADTGYGTKIFTGVIENVSFDGYGQSEEIRISGRDYAAVLQDIMVSPRIFKNKEASEIITTLMTQNVPTSLVTANNVDTTTVTIDKITFNNISVFDAIQKVAEIAGFFFYVDENKDLNFKEKETTSSGETFNNTNVISATFQTDDSDVFNKITVQGQRQLTGARETFTVGTDNTGSLFELDAQPNNTTVTVSGNPNTIIQPGGVIYINDPYSEDAKFLVDYNSSSIILTSGLTAGDNVYPNGSIIIIDYFRSTPLIKIEQDLTSIGSYGPKHKILTDKNIRDIFEANEVADTFLAEHKDPKIQGDLDIQGILQITPGKTAIVNLPNFGQSGVTYQVMNSYYSFDPESCYGDRAMKVSLNRKVPNLIDFLKDQVMRLRALEGAEVDTKITELQLSTGSIGISGSAKIIQIAAGSGFTFQTGIHDILNSPNSLLGPVLTGGSTVIII